MSLLHDRPKTSDVPPTEADVLIEEARRRHRHRLAAIGTTVILLAALTTGLVSAFGGSPPPVANAGDGGSNGQPSPLAGTAAPSLGATLERGRASVPWVVSEYNGTPFGDLAVANNGTLYFIDFEYGQIDELTPKGPRILISSLTGSSSANSSIPALSGFYVTSHNLWFSAQGGIYEANLEGHDIFSSGSFSSGSSDAFGIVNLDVLDDGTTIYYTTSDGVFERTLQGTTKQVAGGGQLGPGQWTNGKPATEIAVQPHDIVGLSPSAFDFTTDDNQLDVVRNGTLSQTSGFHNGEMTESASGTIYGICAWSLCRIDESSSTPVFKIPTIVDGGFVAPSAIAVAPNGNFYESFTNQSSPNNVAGIFEMSPTGRMLRVVVIRKQTVYG